MTTTESPTKRESVVARAVYLAKGYLTNPDDDSLTRQGREYYDADKNRTATDVAYLIIKGYQQRLPL